MAFAWVRASSLGGFVGIALLLCSSVGKASLEQLNSTAIKQRSLEEQSTDTNPTKNGHEEKWRENILILKED